MTVRRLNRKVSERKVADLTALEHVRSLSSGDRNSGNVVIQGDNLAVLGAIESAFRSQVRCVYIDPPYNNRERYTHFVDDIDHRSWLKSIRDRLVALRPFLSEDGTIWISIDDSEVHYLKVAADDVFGRENFLTTVIWEQRTSRENRKAFSNNHEYLLCYAKNAREGARRLNGLPASADLLDRYRNPDNDARGLWQSISANVQAGHGTDSQFYELVAPNGKRHLPPKGRCWAYGRERMQREIDADRVWFGGDGNGVPRVKKFLANSHPTLRPETLWRASEVGTTLAAKRHLLQLFTDEEVFDTPKPESLVQRVLQIATEPNDIVIDAYLGSGTTAAVAHKFGRRYIGIEVGDHAVSHCANRLRKVIAGESGGVSNALDWRGGGGFDFYRLEANERK